MRFNIPDACYRAEVASDPLYDDDGNRLYGVSDFDKHLIQISPECPLNLRPQVIYHEYAHPWIEWGGLPQTTEQFCDLFARMFASLLDDIMRQGGPDALVLMDLQQQERYDAACYSLTIEQLGVEHLYQCFKCQQRIAGGSVLASAPRHEATVASMVVDLATYCDNCDHVINWAGFASKTGKPSGAMAGEPKYLRGAERDAFLMQHGEKFGVFI